MKNQKAASLDNFLLQTNKIISPRGFDKIGVAHTVDKNTFPTLDGVTCFTLELWEECMRLPHWHPNASELGFVVSGKIEIILWRAPGESAVFTLTAGMCWFIPQAALHSLNNIGKEHAKLLVGFSTDLPQDIDLPVAFNGLPAPVRDAYTNPHAELRKWVGINDNKLIGRFHPQNKVLDVLTASPYGFDLAKVTPLYQSAELGSVIWGVKSNWSILENISVLHANLKPGVARDAIWYPDAGTLYVVHHGMGEFNLIMADHESSPLKVTVGDYIFVPIGVLHTFINTGKEDFAVTAFFTKADPLPEISLSVATGFFPKTVAKSALTEYGTEKLRGDPLQGLRYTEASPYLLK